MNAQCDASRDLAIAFRTIGWADGARAIIADRGSVETHPMLRTSVQPGGDSESYQLGPLIADRFVPGEATALRCGPDSTGLSAALLTIGRATPWADCVVFGDDLDPIATALQELSLDLFEQCRILPSSSDTL